MFGALKKIAEIMLVTVCGYYIGVAAYTAVQPVDVVVPEIGSETSGVRGEKKINQNVYNIINDRNLFDAFDPAKVVVRKKPRPKRKPKKDLSQLPVAASTYRLSGTVYATDPKLRRCIVLVNGKVSVLKNGDKLKQFTVADIKRRAVVLQSGKRQEILLIDSDDKKIALQSDSGSVLISNKGLKKTFANPEEILSKVDFAPARVDGKKGLLINSIPNKSVLAEAGIKNGDLIVSVNGKGLQSMNDIMGLAKMKVKDSIEIKIWRNKRYETLKLKFNDA